MAIACFILMFLLYPSRKPGAGAPAA
jgi:hypothetical protein